MFKKIKIQGDSSKKLIQEISMNSSDDTSLMDLLRENNIPIASSCYGDGVCKKCTVSNDIISCQIKVRDFIKLSVKYNDIITISYL
jgi:Na+-transporting NADH:ubiquinone oxidoreductase subunit NqrF